MGVHIQRYRCIEVVLIRVDHLRENLPFVNEWHYDDSLRQVTVLFYAFMMTQVLLSDVYQLVAVVRCQWE